MGCVSCSGLKTLRSPSALACIWIMLCRFFCILACAAWAAAAALMRDGCGPTDGLWILLRASRGRWGPPTSTRPEGGCIFTQPFKDLVIVGGGRTGLVGAARASSRGRAVTPVDAG